MITPTDLLASARELLPWLRDVRRHLHAHPELSFQEYKTAEFVEAQLTTLGLKPTRVAETGVVAHLGQVNAPCIALRADLDALPIHELNDVAYKSQQTGVMHACGHDVHTTCLLGAVQLLVKHSPKGCVKFIFQPGEEKAPGGASKLIEAGVLRNTPVPRAIAALHVFPEMPVGRVGWRSGRYMASADEIRIVFKGTGGHAAMPHKLTDPVAMTLQMLPALQALVQRKAPATLPTVLSFGRIEALGATNVIPNEVKVEGTFRTMNESWREEALQIIEEQLPLMCRAWGGDAEVNITRGYPVLENHPELTHLCGQALQNLLGKDNTHQLDLRMTAEDFAFYGHHIPAFFFRLGTGNESRGIVHPVHSPRFDIDEEALAVGAASMAAIALHWLDRQDEA